MNTSTTAKVQYTYASGSSNTIRATGMVYPSGRVLTYSYGSTGGQSDRLSRVASYIDDDGTSRIIDYTFLGAGTFVESDRPQPSLKWSIITDQGGDDPNTGDIYRGLDRFGRVKDNQWFGYGTGTNVDVDRIRYGYDRAGNRIWRENPVATSYNKEFDEIYSYDALHRLKDMARGRLNTAKTALTSTTFAQCWTLDATGNWSGFREDDTGDGTWDRVQSRTANGVNEIANISATVGPAPITPTYSPAGNMTTIPATGGIDWNSLTLAEWETLTLDQWQNLVLDSDETPYAYHQATYDAWNRLVKLVGQPGNQTVAEYAYDGAKRQIRQKNYDAGTLTETRHLYYTDPASWRCLEERLGTTPDTAPPDRQFVWGSRYIDDLILRDRNVTSSSSSSGGATGPNPLGERLFACQDAIGSNTSISSMNGDITTRFAYSAFGEAELLSSDFSTLSNTDTSWCTLFCGYRFESAAHLAHVRFRTYSPLIGSWLSRDAIFNEYSVSLYQYVAPISSFDPFGLSPMIAPPPAPPPVTTTQVVTFVFRVLQPLAAWCVAAPWVCTGVGVVVVVVTIGVTVANLPGPQTQLQPQQNPNPAGTTVTTGTTTSNKCNCKVKYPHIPTCPEEAKYKDDKEACSKCNAKKPGGTSAFTPKGDLVPLDYTDGLEHAQHRSCEYGGQGHSVICGKCCDPKSTSTEPVHRCKCAPKRR